MASRGSPARKRAANPPSRRTPQWAKLIQRGRGLKLTDRNRKWAWGDLAADAAPPNSDNYDISELIRTLLADLREPEDDGEDGVLPSFDRICYWRRCAIAFPTDQQRKQIRYRIGIASLLVTLDAKPRQRLIDELIADGNLTAARIREENRKRHIVLEPPVEPPEVDDALDDDEGEDDVVVPIRQAAALKVTPAPEPPAEPDYYSIEELAELAGKLAKKGKTVEQIAKELEFDSEVDLSGQPDIVEAILEHQPNAMSRTMYDTVTCEYRSAEQRIFDIENNVAYLLSIPPDGIESKGTQMYRLNRRDRAKLRRIANTIIKELRKA